MAWATDGAILVETNRYQSAYEIGFEVANRERSRCQEVRFSSVRQILSSGLDLWAIA